MKITPQLLGLFPSIVALLLAAPAPAATFRVGAGAGCSHSNLADAISAAASSAGPDEILLLSGSTHQGVFFVLNNPVDITGGYSSCTANAPSGNSTLRGGNGTAALAIALGEGQSARLRRLTLEGGTGITGNGGGLAIAGRGVVELNQIRAFGGQASGRGGNLYVSGNLGLEVPIVDSLFAAGEAADGGGIACSGPARISLDPTSAVANNTASGNGGGIFLANGCVLTSTAGGNLAGISGNTATQGGGVYLETAAFFRLAAPSRTTAATLGSNQAIRGGGLYATGSQTSFTVLASSIEGNSATGEGGGVYLGAQATGFLAGADACPDGRRCSRLSSNTAGEGGAAYVGGGGALSVTGTYVENNVATARHPVASLVDALRFRAVDSVLAGNRGSAPIGATGAAGTTVYLEGVTVAGNLDVAPGFLFLDGDSAQVSILNSVFAQSGTLFASAPAGFAPRLDCVMTAQAALLSSVPATAIVRAVVANDPRLESSRLGYQLKIGSPAVDFCDGAATPGSLTDIEGDPRTFDDPSHPDFLPGGFRDLGADEMVRLFVDGFESGSTAAWGQTLP